MYSTQDIACARSAVEAADISYVKCINISCAADGIKTFTFSQPSSPKSGVPSQPLSYAAGQYASFNIRVRYNTRACRHAEVVVQMT